MYGTATLMPNHHGVGTYSALGGSWTPHTSLLHEDGGEWPTTCRHRAITGLTFPNHALDKRLGVPHVDVFCG